MSRLYLFLISLLLILFCFVGCGEDALSSTSADIVETTPQEEIVIKPSGVTLSRDALKLYVGNSFEISATVTPSDTTAKAVIFTSSNDSIATVSSAGVVTAKGVGSAEIKAVCGDVQDSLTVEVIDEKQDGYYFYSTFSADALPPEVVISNSEQGAYEITDGELHLTTVDTDYINGRIYFDEGIDGYLVAEASVKVETGAFSNLFYFYTSESSTDGVVCSVAAENGQFKYHNGSGWVDLEPCHAGNFYEIIVILRIGDRTKNADKGCFDICIDGRWHRDLSLRKGGDGVEDSIQSFFFGSNKPDTHMVYDYLYLKKAEKPFLFLKENEATLEFPSKNEYNVTYELEGTPSPEVSVSCEKTEGWSYSDGKLTFTKPGSYSFTVSASNEYGSDSDTLIVTVNAASAAPELTVKESSKTLILGNGVSYTLSYDSYHGAPEAVKTVTCNKANGYVMNGDTVTFSAVGEYVFTITLTNAIGSDSDTVSVKVVTERVVFEEDFADKPDGTTVTTTGSGGIAFEDGLLKVTTGSGSCQAFADIPLGVALTESYTVSVDFTVKTGAFSNFMFLLANGTAPASNGGICIAVENGTLKYHNGSSWLGITPVELGVQHNMTTVFDWDTMKQEIFLDGVSLGVFAVRNGNNAKNAVHFYLGSDKSNTDYTVDHIKITYHGFAD